MSHPLSGSATDPSPFPAPAGIDPAFVVDWNPAEEPLDETQRWSTWRQVEPLCRGPEPRPDWLVTDEAALDTDLGVLKTGKEADVVLLERAVPGTTGVVMAAKRYRGVEHRSFHRSASYTEGRRTRNSRDARALAKKSAHGRAVAAGQWAWAEWEALCRFTALGLPVPYPVQIDGTELLLELVRGDDGDPAPRLAATRPSPALLADWFEQLREALVTMTSAGIVHGDLSPYNILAAGDRLVVIDLPQAVDLVANPQGADFLLRDCTNVCTWFRRRGLEVDEHALFAELLAVAW